MARVELKVTDNLERFLDLDWTEYRLANKWIAKESGKSAVKEKFYQEMAFYLGDAIEFYIYNNMRDDIKAQRICEKIARQIAVLDGGFVKYLIKLAKKYKLTELEEYIPKISQLPIVLRFFIGDIMNADPDCDINEKAPELAELYRLLIKKKLKKAEKLKIDMQFAYDVLGVMPTKDSFKYGKGRRVHDVFVLMYKWAKNLQEDFSVDALMHLLFRETQFPTVIMVALSERQSKLEKLNDEQKVIADMITDWCFEKLEMMNDRDMSFIVNNYFLERKRADRAGKDEPRRFYFGSIPDTRYPRLVSTINQLTAKNQAYKKYL